MQIDNSTLRQKIAMRISGLEIAGDCRIVETNGGFGKVGDACGYEKFQGMVFEKMEPKAKVLALKRPAWMVFEADAVKAIKGMKFSSDYSFFDVDPYGDPFEYLAGIANASESKRLIIAVNDGLRNKAKRGGSFACESLKKAVHHFGNDSIYDRYLEVVDWITKDIFSNSGFKAKILRGYHCKSGDMTHYLIEAVK